MKRAAVRDGLSFCGRKTNKQIKNVKVCPWHRKVRHKNIGQQERVIPMLIEFSEWLVDSFQILNISRVVGVDRKSVV